MDPTQPRLVRYGSGRFVPTLEGDPGPVPPEPRARKGPYEIDEQPEIALLMWIFQGMNVTDHGRYRRVKPMTAEERIEWMRRWMPKTYLLLAHHRNWDEAFT